MICETSAPLRHGGDLTEARRQFPHAPEPFLDLSTGINPRPYPIPQISSELLARLPQSAEVDRLCAAAAAFYGAPSRDCVLAAPGTQLLLPLVASLVPAGAAAILGPTYAEHARACALAGHAIKEVHQVGELARVNPQANLAIVVNPNNPDGRLSARGDLLALAKELRSRAGLLVVDEAFMEVAPDGSSLAPEVDRGSIVVLRSFGKFFGLAGLRLGFALAAPELVARLAAWLGPWAVSSGAIAAGRAGLDDPGWAKATRLSLERDAQRLDDLLRSCGLEIAGGTSLFRLAAAPAADALFRHLGNRGIWVRRFTEQPSRVRFGLPAGEEAWTRLSAALGAFAL
ncbi:MAG TPA: threonine-phosphate decarboxylase CobD [Xanthobacteraceae bacterium]|jgi:cobalamin biosynthetic protein CobC